MGCNAEWIPYQIYFILRHPVVSEIDKLGRIEFPAGAYVYIGQLGGARIERLGRSILVE
jgi:hypothetical protein